jgi:hypothetical protein
MAERKFEVVEESDSVEPAAVAGVMLALRALSQRALIAAADLFCLFTVFGAWWLWWSVPDPNAYQITSLSIYALFVLAANWIVRKR